MSQPNSSSSTSAQDLLDALIDCRQTLKQQGLGISDMLRDSGRFSALMRDLRPGMKKEILILSGLINEGWLIRLYSADAEARVGISGHIKAWLDNFGLKAEEAQAYSDVLLAFCNGETQVRTEAPQKEAPQKEQARHEPQANSKAPQVPGTASPSVHVSPLGTSRSVIHYYMLSFALLVLAAAIFLTKGPGLGGSSPEPAVTPVASQSVASSPELTGASASAQSVVSSESYADKQVGELFDFGRYPQGANGEIEPITWRVLQREADHLLVIAEKGLDCKPYNEECCEITWSDCTLRRWLNSEFYDKAFNAHERECILKTSVANNAGPNTEDNIFLLSVDEAESLFANDDERRAKTTEHAVKNGVYTRDDSDCCCWWLRSRGDYASGAACVCNDGSIFGGGDVNDGLDAVRPAFKIALSPEQPTATSAAAQSVVFSESYADKQVGELFDFGRYPQGADGEIEPITWRVLQRNADHLLVIAEQGLDYKQYHKQNCCITWADCTLRRWLNSEFYYKAFNEQERKCILKTSVANNAGPNTEDNIFLLSVDEAESLFANDDERRAKPTDYATKNEAAYTDGNGYCWWWLRSRGNYVHYAAFVAGGGGVFGFGDHVWVGRAVRPAFRIAL